VSEWILFVLEISALVPAVVAVAILHRSCHWNQKIPVSETHKTKKKKKFQDLINLTRKGSRIYGYKNDQLN